MLVLTRKLQEQIRIGDNIIITVLEMRGSSIRLGIEAPRDVRVMREELPRREITINLEATTENQDISRVFSMSTTEPTDSVAVQVIVLDRKLPVRSSIDHRVANVKPAKAARNPLGSKLASRRAGNIPNSTAIDSSADPRPEADLFGQDHLLAAQKENSRSFSSAI